MLGSVMHFLSLQAYSHSVAFRKAWLGSQEANRQLSHARAWESLSLSFLGTPMEAFFNAPLLYHLSWNPVEATGTPESHRSGVMSSVLFAMLCPREAWHRRNQYS